ncbi:hypothetical protein GS682_07735 [Nostoc sp. B(2019)]|nr:hypothetical protein [Nostoc sp. B(2019)]
MPHLPNAKHGVIKVKLSLIYLNIIDNQFSEVSQDPSGLLDCRSECRRLDDIPVHREV